MKKIDPPRYQTTGLLHFLLKPKHWQLLVPVLLFFTAVHAQPPFQPSQQNSSASPKNSYENVAITYQIIDASNNTYGYDVFVDGKLVIHQTSIPAMPGNDGFKTKEEASKVAELVEKKIRKGEMPPTVSIEELKHLGVIK